MGRKPSYTGARYAKKRKVAVPVDNRVTRGNVVDKNGMEISKKTMRQTVTHIDNMTSGFVADDENHNRFVQKLEERMPDERIIDLLVDGVENAFCLSKDGEILPNYWIRRHYIMLILYLKGKLKENKTVVKKEQTISFGW